MSQTVFYFRLQRCCIAVQVFNTMKQPVVCAGLVERQGSLKCALHYDVVLALLHMVNTHCSGDFEAPASPCSCTSISLSAHLARGPCQYPKLKLIRASHIPLGMSTQQPHPRLVLPPEMSDMAHTNAAASFTGSPAPLALSEGGTTVSDGTWVPSGNAALPPVAITKAAGCCPLPLPLALPLALPLPLPLLLTLLGCLLSLLLAALPATSLPLALALALALLLLLASDLSVALVVASLRPSDEPSGHNPDVC